MCTKFELENRVLLQYNCITKSDSLKVNPTPGHQLYETFGPTDGDANLQAICSTFRITFL